MPAVKVCCTLVGGTAASKDILLNQCLRDYQPRETDMVKG